MRLFRFGFLFAFASAAAVQDAQAMDEATAAKVRALPWVHSGSQTLPLSNSTVALQDGYNMVVGESARELMRLVGEPVDPELEADVLDQDFGKEVLFSFFDVGYVTLDDWKDIDPDEMIDSIKEGTEEANETRRKNGSAPIHVRGWLRKPTLDQATNTVYWAISADDGSPGGLVNSVALRLGRSGYEELTWVTDQPGYVPQGGALDQMTRAHTFNPGARYADFLPGDKTAGYGIAALVGTVVGVKVLKAGGLVFLLVLLKKFGVIIVAAVGAALIKMKRIFKRSAGA
jgi:uncharacterized membrane-anchored protein